MNEIAPYRCQESMTGHQVPLVIDSPHSGGILPPDLNWHGDLRLLLVNEDVGVDTLLADAPLLGIALLTATISRHYIDLNRAPDDLDPQVVQGVTANSHGHEAGGLVRALPGRLVPISLQEVENRRANVWWPYHRRLAALLHSRQVRYGAAWHLNTHSMPAGTRNRQGQVIDIVLGDRNGTTASPEFVDVVAGLCRKEGLVVSHNDPYPGVECVRRHGQPAKACHSLQLEIGRQLFYNEEKFRFLPQMETFRVALNRILRGVVAYTESAVRSGSARAAE